MDSRLRSDEGLTEANKAREAGLGDRLKHKFELMCKHEPRISRRAIARRLLEEEDGLRCHECQRAKWVSDGGDLLPDARCNYYQRYGKCQKCDDCTMSYMRLAKWCDAMREKLKNKPLTEAQMKDRMCETLAKRIGKIDTRLPRRQSTRKVRRGVPRG